MESSRILYRNIRRLYRQNQKYSISKMEHPDLTPSELQLVRHIGFHGEVSQRHLAEDLGVDKAMISRTLQKLEAKGYLVRREDESDARSKKVLALPPAKEIHMEGRGLSERFFDSITEDFTEEEIASLIDLLERMVEKGKLLNAAGKGAAVGAEDAAATESAATAGPLDDNNARKPTGTKPGTNGGAQ